MFLTRSFICYMYNWDSDLVCKQNISQCQTGWLIFGVPMERRAPHATPHHRGPCAILFQQFYRQWTDPLICKLYFGGNFVCGIKANCSFKPIHMKRWLHGLFWFILYRFPKLLMCFPISSRFIYFFNEIIIWNYDGDILSADLIKRKFWRHQGFI